MRAHGNPQGDSLARELALAAILDPLAVPGLRDSELDLTLRVLRRMRLLGRLASQLSEHGLVESLPPVARDQLRSAIALAEARSRLLDWELQQISRCLGPRDDDPVVALKGAAYLMLDLPNARGRLPSDVDLLVPERSLRAREQRLREGGWQAVELTPYDERYYREWTHEIPPMRHPEREMEVDLHHNILQRTARLRPEAARLLARVRPARHGLMVLSPVDMVLHAMTHLFASSEPEDSMRELVDIASLLRHFEQREPGFWDDFSPRARELDLALPAFYALRYGQRLLQLQVPAQVIALLEESAPSAAALRAMDWCVPRALLAQHPDEPDASGSIARTVLLARAHWIRMPPLLLGRHLARKSLVRWRARSGGA